MIPNTIKKTAIFMSLLLIMTLSACFPFSRPESSKLPLPTREAETEQTQRPEKTPKPEETAKVEESPEQGEPLHSGMLYAVEQEPSDKVRVYHVRDELFNQPELVEYELVDLNELEAYYESEDSYEGLLGSQEVSSRIIFMTDSPVKNFRYLSIKTSLFEDGMGIELEELLFQLDTLEPGMPFVVNWISPGDVSMYRGFSFEDEDGVTRYLGFNISGYDGDLYFIEFA